MNRVLFFVLVALTSPAFAQNGHDLIFPEGNEWTIGKEGETISFQLKATYPETLKRFALESDENLAIQFDSLGNFTWKPSFDLVNRVELRKEFTIIFQATWIGGKRERKSITFTILHVNRSPIAEELPVFYVKQSTRNNYQISGDYVSDPDGDPIVFKSIVSQMPEGMSLTSLGQIVWAPSRSQFYALKNNPLSIEFIVQDQPDKAETRGKIRIAQTQVDLPPELLIVPGDSSFSLKEDETLNLKIYVSDPNGDENVRSAGFVSSDTRISPSLLKENTPLQYEFTWLPKYDFVNEAQKNLTANITFFALDKSNNRIQKKISITIFDTENVVEKDAHQYQKYRSNLASALILIKELDENQKKLNEDYKKAKKGKKKRSVITASLGAITGFSPVFMEPDQSQIVSGVGGTTVLTLSTLEATEVIGKSKDDIMDKIKINIDIRNKVQSAGDDFARKHALKSSRRLPEFEKEIEKLRNAVTDQRIVLLELDAYRKVAPKVGDQDIKKIFPDFAEEN